MIKTGQKLQGRYIIREKVGRGSFGVVYRADDILHDHAVAIKVIPQSEVEGNQVLSLLDEARKLAKNNHPNIVKVENFGETEDEAYLVMPFADGGTLHHKLQQWNQLPFEVVGHFLQQIAAGLDYAHSNGILHRDLKPLNVLLFNPPQNDPRLDEIYWKWQAQISDFGLAKALSEKSLYASTRINGTPAYMAPEQFRGHVGRRSDIYALGITLYQMLAGILPFTGTQYELMWSHENAPLPKLTEKRRGVPRGLQELLEQATAKRPEERFATGALLTERYWQLISAGINATYAELDSGPIVQTLLESDYPNPQAVAQASLEQQRIREAEVEREKRAAEMARQQALMEQQRLRQAEKEKQDVISLAQEKYQAQQRQAKPPVGNITKPPESNTRKKPPLVLILGAVSIIVLLAFGLVIMAAMLVSSNATTNSNSTGTANAVNFNKNVTALVARGNATAAVLESNNKATATAYAAEIAKINATKSAVDDARATVDVQNQLTAAALGTPLPTFTPKPTLAPIPTGGVKRPVWHNVTVGQNIQRLAAMYDTTVKVIVEANRNATTLGYPPDKVLIDAPDSADPIIHVGDKLAIPVGRQEFKGFAIIWSERNSKPDELQKLEKDYGVTIDYLLAYNGIPSMVELKKDDPLLIPYEKK
ncbi:MAG: protein kinase [Chloroflexi bacterium]|nr:protein kinase [Chloroflexota bacterium]